MTLSDRLFEEGVFAQGIGFPDRRPGQGAGPHDRHRHAHARGAHFALDCFEKVGRELGVI